MKKLRIHRFISSTKVEGPEKRACLWVQGCQIQCKVSPKIVAQTLEVVCATNLNKF